MSDEQPWSQFCNATFQNLSTVRGRTLTISDTTQKCLNDTSDANAMRLLSVIVYLGALMIIGVVGNSLVLYVHFRKFKPSTTRTYVISLAIFDLLSCFISIPGEIVDIRYSFNFDSGALCKAERLCTTFTTLGSGFTLIAVAVDRYRRICHPLRQQLLVRKAKWIVLIATLASCLLAWPALIIYGIKQVKIKHSNILGMECSTDDSLKGSIYPVIYTGVLALAFLVSFFVMLALYVFIGKKIYEQNIFRKTSTSKSLKRIGTCSTDDNNTPSSQPMGRTPTTFSPERPSYDEANDEYSIASIEPAMKVSSTNLNRKPSAARRIKSKRDSLSRKTTFMLFLISLVFVVSFLPHLILKIVQALRRGVPQNNDDVASQIVYNIFVRSYFVNSISNAFIYGFCSPRFRKESAALFRTLMCKDISKSFDVFNAKS